MNNIVIVIRRSDFEGQGNSKYESCKSSETNDVMSAANVDTKKCLRDTSTKKYGCPFLTKGVNTGEEDDWKFYSCFRISLRSFICKATF